MSWTFDFGVCMSVLNKQWKLKKESTFRSNFWGANTHGLIFSKRMASFVSWVFECLYPVLASLQCIFPMCVYSVRQLKRLKKQRHVSTVSWVWTQQTPICNHRSQGPMLGWGWWQQKTTMCPTKWSDSVSCLHFLPYNKYSWWMDYAME